MVSYPRFTPTERRKLTMSARARESFRAVGIRGGAGPGEGAPATPGSYYELSEDDRALIEQVLDDAQSADNLRAATARQWFHDALNQLDRFAPLILTVPNLVSLVMDFGGFWGTANFSEVSSAVVQIETDNYYGALTGLSVGARYSVGAERYQVVSGSAAFVLKDWSCQYNDVNDTTTWHMPNIIGGGSDAEGVEGPEVVTLIGPRGCTSSATAPGDLRTTSFPESCPSPVGVSGWIDYDGGAIAPNEHTASWSQTYNVGDTEYCFYGTLSSGENTVFTSMPVCVGEDFLAPMPDLEGLEGSTTPPGPSDFDFTPDELCDLADALKDYPYAPPPGTPPGGIPPGDNPVDPGTGLPPGELPTQPPDPGVNPFPGQPATDVPPGTGDPGLPPGDPGLPVPDTVPPGPVVPAVDPVDSGIEDPAAGGCMTLSKEPAGFRDPKQAGGIARQYQPGQPMIVDYGEGSPCKTKITKVKPNAGDDGGPEICVSGQIDNSGKITEKTCYGPGPVEDAIRSVLGDMVAEDGEIIFDSDCARELHRPLCFRAGTLKRVILNTLLDMCGFCVFPMFDCNVIVGYCAPVGVVWTYHEDVDLIKFDLEYDGQEIFDYVQVCRGDFMTQSGSVAIRGNCVLYPVGSPASSPNGERVYEYEVPYGTPDSELNSIAITLAAKLRAQALPEIAFGVPLNSLLRTRHQLRIQMPSVGFDAYYMVTRLARDYDRENGHLSTGLARWLHAA